MPAPPSRSPPVGNPCRASGAVQQPGPIQQHGDGIEFRPAGAAGAPDAHSAYSRPGPGVFPPARRMPGDRGKIGHADQQRVIARPSRSGRLESSSRASTNELTPNARRQAALRRSSDSGLYASIGKPARRKMLRSHARSCAERSESGLSNGNGASVRRSWPRQRPESTARPRGRCGSQNTTCRKESGAVVDAMTGPLLPKSRAQGTAPG